MSRRRGPPAANDTSALWSGPDPAVTTPTPSSGAPRDAQSTPTRRKTAPLFAPGTTLAGRYRLARFIAAGGMGEVYEAEDLVLGAKVALKTIGPDVAGHDQAMERFRRETLLARRVTHPNVCRIFDLGHHSSAALGPDVTFLTMEMLSGETLRQRLLARGPLGVAEALPVIAQMAAGLTAAHRAGVIHRDFKSANVMLVPSPSGGEPRVVVTDFGLASATADNLDSITDSWQIVGTPAYVAPEQIEDRQHALAADVVAEASIAPRDLQQLIERRLVPLLLDVELRQPETGLGIVGVRAHASFENAFVARAFAFVGQAQPREDQASARILRGERTQLFSRRACLLNLARFEQQRDTVHLDRIVSRFQGGGLVENLERLGNVSRVSSSDSIAAQQLAWRRQEAIDELAHRGFG